MREFFKGWRRKLGVLTLGLACALMTGWVRSGSLLDESQIRLNHTAYLLRSMHGMLCWYSFYPTDDAATMILGTTRLDGYAFDPMLKFDCTSHTEFGVFPFGSANLNSYKRMQVRLLAIRYWTVVIPLTLLSA